MLRKLDLRIHNNLQVGLVNVDGYFNSLLSFIDKAVEEGFISPNARHIIVSASTSKELVKKLEVNNFHRLIDKTKVLVYAITFSSAELSRK